MPRRSTLVCEWAAPSVRALPPSLWAKGRTKGAAQISVNSSGEAEPRLTSGGEAATFNALKGLFVQSSAPCNDPIQEGSDQRGRTRKRNALGRFASW
jgi:hypothetical protein